jgi:hypothetical protein
MLISLFILHSPAQRSVKVSRAARIALGAFAH